MKFNIPFIKPSFPEAADIAADYRAILDSNWYTNFGHVEQRFRLGLAEYLGEGVHVATVANATLGLMLAIHAVMGRGAGDKYVFVPSFTFAAGPQSIEWCGFKPYFIDVVPGTVQMDLDQVRAAYAAEPDSFAGILFCNAFGIGDAAIADWEEFARSSSLGLVIDSAAGFGSRYADGTPVGTRGDCEIFSFHATKPFAIGEGGAVTSQNPEIIGKIIQLENFGFKPGAGAVDLGMNAKLTEFAAAVGLRQLERFNERLESRQSVLKRYHSALPSGFIVPEGAERSSLCFASFITPANFDRDGAISRLGEAGIVAAKYYFPAVHLQPHYADRPKAWRATSLQVTESLGSRMLSLPVHDDMSSAHITAIADIVKETR